MAQIADSKRAIITKYYKLGSLEQRTLPTVLEARSIKSNSQMTNCLKNKIKSQMSSSKLSKSSMNKNQGMIHPEGNS